jgi:hypothetical protein
MNIKSRIEGLERGRGRRRQPGDIKQWSDEELGQFIADSMGIDVSELTDEMIDSIAAERTPTQDLLTKRAACAAAKGGSSTLCVCLQR